MDLKNQQCVPCQIGAPILNTNQIQNFLSQISSDWGYEKNPDKIIREFKFKDFKDALRFVNKVGELAESQDHHPNIHVHDWNKVKLELWTHKINGLHQNDFILASKIDTLV